LEALQDPDARIRSAAYSSLAIHGRLEHLVRLAEGLDDPAPEVREHVIGCLVDQLLGTDLAGEGPARFLKRKWTPAEASQTRKLTHRLKERFKQYAQSEQGQARNDAIIGLQILAPRQASAYLLKLAKSKGVADRVAAASLIGRISRKTHFDSLSRLLKDTDATVRRAAALGFQHGKNRREVSALLKKALKMEKDEAVVIAIQDVLELF
jgi:HEAT repeat protein